MKGGHCAPILTECLRECEKAKTFMEFNKTRDCLYICAFGIKRLYHYSKDAPSKLRLSQFQLVPQSSLRCKVKFEILFLTPLNKQ